MTGPGEHGNVAADYERWDAEVWADEPEPDRSDELYDRERQRELDDERG